MAPQPHHTGSHKDRPHGPPAPERGPAPVLRRPLQCASGPRLPLLSHGGAAEPFLGDTQVQSTLAQGPPEGLAETSSTSCPPPSLSFPWHQICYWGRIGLPATSSFPAPFLRDKFLPLQSSPRSASDSQRSQANTTSTSPYISNNSLWFPNEIPLTYDRMKSKRIP